MKERIPLDFRFDTPQLPEIGVSHDGDVADLYLSNRWVGQITIHDDDMIRFHPADESQPSVVLGKVASIS